MTFCKNYFRGTFAVFGAKRWTWQHI
jgi:hypothetical protein